MPPPDRVTVSCVIPAYNAEHFIHRAIECVLAQTLPMHEIIVVDDGSSDRTVQAASAYPVRVLTKKNGGPASARNAGAKVATGEWIAFLDHDDHWAPRKTELQIPLIQDGIDAVFGPKFEMPEEVTFEQMFWRNYGGTPSGLIVRRTAFFELGLFDDDRELIGVEDYNFWLRFLLQNRRFAVSAALHEFTPVETHYSGNPAKMLSAEIANIRKIGALAGIDREVIDRRIRAARLEYLPDLIHVRQLAEARKCLRALGIDREALTYWGAFAPEWALDARRRLLRSRQHSSARPKATN
jgi:glycosyltransferase involved in cell wall biosynthesis